MRHPERQLFGDDALPWCVFREVRGRGGRTERAVVRSGLARPEAERAARVLGAAQRGRYGRALFYAGPQEASS